MKQATLAVIILLAGTSVAQVPTLALVDAGRTLDGQHGTFLVQRQMRELQVSVVKRKN